MDGRSFAHLVAPGTFPAPVRPWKDTHLTTYQSISPNHCTNASTGKYTCKGRHEEDDATNTHRSIRVKNATHNFLYAEFTDGSMETDWAWPAVRVCV